jgi:formylglycine-generating enzyme required for sulfatase activity
VGQKLPNAWGLYDMAGNVCEWCHDGFQDSWGTAAVTDPVGSNATDFVVRGSSWNYLAFSLRAAYRVKNAPATARFDLGFRCVKTVLP